MKKKNPKINEKNKGTIPPVATEPKNPPKWFYAVPILLPVVLLILLELSLRLFHYGKTIETWVPYHPNLPGKIVLNTEFAYKYFFTTKGIPSSNFDPFDAVKKPGTFRVFVLGESSAAGFPFDPTGSYSRYVRDRLQLVYPEQNIEVVNVSMAAINSIVIKDMLPEVLEQQPDLILLYVGHNEYYGVLGAASQTWFAGNTTMISWMLYLNHFKIVELLRNAMNGISSLFKSDKQSSGATLMARMAKNNLVPYQSDLYKAGLKQFENCLTDIIEEIKAKKVPLIIGTLTSNLKDQPPFISLNDKEDESADHFFKKAKEALQEGNAVEAKKYFIRAKELDALRFRAPEEMNSIIEKLAASNNIPLIDFEKAFNALSKDGVAGNNLFVDHLHPTLHGYMVFGKLFYEAMEKNKFLPKASPQTITDTMQDSLVVKNFPFTRLDSTICSYRLISLLADFPFVKDGRRKELRELVQLKDYSDSLAYRVIAENYYWEGAHKLLAASFKKEGNLDGYVSEYEALIGQFPYTVSNYKAVVETLIGAKRYPEATVYLERYYQLQPDAFCTKWLGTINLLNDNFDVALKYLDESLSFNPRDAQLLWNLSGLFVRKHDYQSALLYVNKCLQIERNFPGAAQLKAQIEQGI